jgi:hypothetical protein
MFSAVDRGETQAGSHKGLMVGIGV